MVNFPKVFTRRKLCVIIYHEMLYAASDSAFLPGREILKQKNTLLQSKIQSPATARNFLVRERLMARIENAEERLIVVSAGMGYGKTVLLTHYARRHPDECAWYHLNEMDNDIMVFVQYLRESIVRVAPEFAMDVSRYIPLDQDDSMVHSLAGEFARELRELGDIRLTMVLDDFQVIHNEWIFRFIQTVLDSGWPGLRLILCMKSAPPAFCARYLMEGNALVLGADSLAFHQDEIKTLIQDQCGAAALDEVSGTVLKRTEGWPAGISFVLLYFRQWQREITVQEVDQACRQSYLRDYFIHEMFRKLPYDLQQFLVNTSVLDYLRPDVCNMMLEIDNAESQLAYLEQENLFILHLSGDGHIYRYHALFRNFLHSQLKEGQRKQLLGRAADFYLRTPDKEQAAEYAIACEDGERLLSAVESAGFDMLRKGRLNTLGRWMERLEAFGTSPTPELLLLQGLYSERVGEWREAAALSEEILALPETQVDESCRIKAGLLLAWLKREWESASDRMEVLDRTVPAGRMDSKKLDELRWWGVELRRYNLLDLGRYHQALDMVLEELEESVRRSSQTGICRAREMTVICYTALGEYRQAMQMYVVLRGNGVDGGSAAPYIDLYLAASGRAGQALNHLNQLMEQQSGRFVRFHFDNLALTRSLVEQMVILDGGAEHRAPVPKGAWSSFESGGGSARERRVLLLNRVFRGEHLSEREEDLVFSMEAGYHRALRDAARWLIVRNAVLEGRRQRALELCRRVEVSLAEEQERLLGGEGSYSNAFLAFLAIEESLLLWDEERERAAAVMALWAPYINENRLHCPGLTGKERELMKDMMSRCCETTAESEEELPSGEKWENAQVRVECFGAFRVTLPDGQEMRWRTRKAQELFAYLFHLGGAGVERERMLDILWPQSAPTNATSLLHTTLYSIRKSLMPYGLDGIIRREKRGYRMDMTLVESSRETIDALAGGKTEDLERLPELYQGSYLEDIEGSWVVDSRAWYASAFLRLCRGGARRAMDQGDYAAAADFLRAAVKQEPYDETLAQQLIRCCASMGEIKNAIAVYNNLKDVLARDLNEEPGEEVTAVYKECLLRRLGRGRS